MPTLLKMPSGRVLNLDQVAWFDPMVGGFLAVTPSGLGLELTGEDATALRANLQLVSANISDAMGPTGLVGGD